MNVKILLLLFFLLCDSLSYGQNKKHVNNFIIKGTINGWNSHAIWLRYPNDSGKIIQQKAFVKHGSFIFKGYISSPVNAEFSKGFWPEITYIRNFCTVSFLSPGVMTVSLDEKGFCVIKMTGSKMQEDWDILEKQKEPLKQIKLSLEAEINQIISGSPTQKNSQKHDLLLRKVEQNNLLYRQADYRFITTHPASYLSPYLTEYYFDGMRELSLDSAKKFYSSFTPLIKNSIAGRSLQRKIARRSVSAVGSFAPLFAKIDISGKNITLKSFRNKNYVLLYFWASYCMPGRGESIHLKRLYNTYHPKGLEIVGLSFDFLSKTWKDTLSKNGMTAWHNILIGYDKLGETYDINGTPPSFLFLVDKKGEIIGRYMGDHVSWEKNGDNEGSMSDLDKKLAEVLGR